MGKKSKHELNYHQCTSSQFQTAEQPLFQNFLFYCKAIYAVRGIIERKKRDRNREFTKA